MSGVPIPSTPRLGRGRDLRRVLGGARSPVIALSGIVISGVVLMAVLRSVLAPQNPGLQHLELIANGPSSAHWFGTDALGRDVLSRAIVGTRSAFLGPLVIAVGSFVIGNVLGLLSGFKRGIADSIIMRWVDMMWSVPTLLVLIVVRGVIGTGYWTAVGILLILTVPFDTRVVRGVTLEQMPRPYVEAAKTLGVPSRRIMFLHVWPNVLPIAIANAFLVFAGSLVVMAGLSFLGLGVPPGTPDWGVMLSENEQLIFLNPVATLVPAVMIVLTASAMNLMGDWLHERLASRGANR
jgi:peptide/nickel transport system permease protein